MAALKTFTPGFVADPGPPFIDANRTEPGFSFFVLPFFCVEIRAAFEQGHKKGDFLIWRSVMVDSDLTRNNPGIGADICSTPWIGVNGFPDQMLTTDRTFTGFQFPNSGPEGSVFINKGQIFLFQFLV